MVELLEKKQLEDDLNKISSRMKELISNRYEASKKELASTENGLTTISDVLTGEEKQEKDRLFECWKDIRAALLVWENEHDRDDVYATASDIYSNDQAIKLKARANARFHEDLMKVGQNRYTAESIHPADGHPGQLCLPAPLIARDPATGRNKVFPVPAVYKAHEDVGGEPISSVEASFRAAEIIKAGKVDEFDLSTGNKLDAVVDTSNLTNSIPDMAVDMYLYLINMNVVAQRCRTYQTENLNKLLIQRRTAIPKATIVGNETNIGQNLEIQKQDSTFSGVALQAFKYAFISQYTWESEQTVNAWSVSQRIAGDGAMGLANGTGEHVIDGAGHSSNEPQGIMTAIKATASQQFTGVSHTKFLGDAGNLFGLDDYMRFITTMPQEYFLSRNRVLLMQLAIFGGLISIVDTQGQPIFLNAMSGGTFGPGALSRGFPNLFPEIILDQNMDDDSATGKYPFAHVDLDGQAVRWGGGGVRIEFTDQLDWTKDLLSFKFVVYFDSTQIDSNTATGYKLA